MSTCRRMSRSACTSVVGSRCTPIHCPFMKICRQDTKFCMYTEEVMMPAGPGADQNYGDLVWQNLHTTRKRTGAVQGFSNLERSAVQGIHGRRISTGGRAMCAHNYTRLNSFLELSARLSVFAGEIRITEAPWWHWGRHGG